MNTFRLLKNSNRNFEKDNRKVKWNVHDFFHLIIFMSLLNFFPFILTSNFDIINSWIKSYAIAKKKSCVHFGRSWIRQRNSVRPYCQEVPLRSPFGRLTSERGEKNTRVAIWWNYSEENRRWENCSKLNHCIIT